MKTRVLALTALTVLLSGFGGVAQAAPAQASNHDGTSLVLSVEGVEAEQGIPLKVTWLDCTGRSGHPRTADACADLATAGGDLAALHVGDRACTMIYEPVRARMFGVWRGQWVSQTRTFPNACVLAGRAGALFDF